MPALDGMKVLDLAQYEAGTSCAQYLAWFGAEVIKVEPPGRGDPGRHTEGGDIDSLYFLTFNGNKRSMAIDLSREEGRALLLEMLPQFDVVVENFTLGTMEKLGLGYDVLAARHPGIIYATIKGFGTHGPYSGFKSFDWVSQASGGSFSVTGEADGPPMKPGATVCDTGSGMHAVMGILAAYIQRQRTGRGQMIEIAMQETMTNFMRQQLSIRYRTGDPVPRRGNKLGIPPTDLYPCAGGGANDWLFIMIATDRMWDSLAMGIGRPDLLHDERFAAIRARLSHGPELYEAIAEWTSQRPKFQAMEELGAAGVPCSAVYDSIDIFADKHLRARDQIRMIEHPVYGAVEMLAPPIHMSDSDVEMVRSPLLGEHTAEVLGELLGLPEGRIAELGAQGVLGLPAKSSVGTAGG